MVPDEFSSFFVICLMTDRLFTPITSDVRPVVLQCIFGADVRRTFSSVSLFQRLASAQILLQLSPRTFATVPVFQVRWGSHARAALSGALFHIRHFEVKKRSVDSLIIRSST